MNSGRALTRHIEHDELCQGYIASDNNSGQKPEISTTKQQLLEPLQHGVMCGMRQAVGAYATLMTATPLSIESLLQKQKEEKEAASKVHILRT